MNALDAVCSSNTDCFIARGSLDASVNNYEIVFLNITIWKKMIRMYCAKWMNVKNKTTGTMALTAYNFFLSSTFSPLFSSSLFYAFKTLYFCNLWYTDICCQQIWCTLNKADRGRCDAVSFQGMVPVMTDICICYYCCFFKKN